MGFVTSGANIVDIIAGIFRTSVYTWASRDVPKNTVYYDMYKATIDFTDIDYLNFIFNIEATDLYLKCSIGGTPKFENHTAGEQQEKVDCTGITGEQVLLVENKNESGVVDLMLNDVSMWASDT